MEFDALTIISLVLTALSICFGFLATRFGSKKNKQNKEQAETSQNILDIILAVRDAMFGVENKEYSAEDKHDVAISQVIQHCIEKKIDYTKYNLDEYVDFIMEIGNTINARDKSDTKNQNVPENITVINKNN